VDSREHPNSAPNGAETDAGAARKTTNRYGHRFPAFPLLQSDTTSQKFNYLRTLRGRLSVLAAPTFPLYATR
jgi:hypothetical protein